MQTNLPEIAEWEPEEQDRVCKSISKWLELNQNITELQQKIAEVRSAQKIVQNDIIGLMNQKDLPEFGLPNGKSLTLKKKQSRKAFTTKMIKAEIMNCQKNVSDETSQKLNEIIKKIENRPVTAIKETLVHGSNS
tara:strand:- start:13565 stop:13969 length:405 start_codon:yes stop_codon:yes gene_type:complete